MSNKTIKPLSIVLGVAFATTLAASNIANAAETGANPFAMTNLESGYQVAKEGKCGASEKAMKKEADGKCGANKKTMMKKDGKCGTGKCGANKKKMMEKDAKCGASMKTPKKMDGKCGASHKTMKEGKCGGSKKK